MRLRRQRASATQADFAGTVCQGGSQAFGSTAGKGGVPGIWQQAYREGRGTPVWSGRAGHLAAQQTKKAAGLQLWSGRAGHLAAQHARKATGTLDGRASKGSGGGVAGNSPATARHRRGNAGQGVPGRAFPAPQAPGDDASQAPTPDATRLPFQRLPAWQYRRPPGSP